MKIEENRLGCALLILYMLLSCGGWLALVTAKVCGVIALNWIIVLLGAFWLPVLVLTFLTISAAALLLAARIKKKYRRRKTDRRIIRQAKAAGVWDRYPTPLGGRALELIARKHGLSRREGETDAQLRSRITEVVENARNM